MTNKKQYRMTGGLLRTALTVLCAALSCGITYGQSGGGSSAGSCTATRLRLTIATADDDLRGGKDNLNIVVYFSNGGYQLAPNVNHSQNWPNNSTNTIGITLNRPIPPNEISGLRLIHIPDGGFNLSISPELATLAAPFVIAEAFQSPDNWNMGDIEIAAIGNGIGAEIGHHGFHRFTGSDPALSIPIEAPADICGSGSGDVGSGSLGHMNPALNPGGSGLRPVTGGSRFGELTNEDVLRMIRTRVPESEIIASIRRSPAKFDLSTNARMALRRAGVSQKIQDAMLVRMNTNGGKNEDDLNPQPYPPKGQLLKPGGQQAMLGPQANAPAGTDAALVPAMQRSAITDGTRVNGSVPTLVSGKAAITDGRFPGGIRPAGAPQIGTSQTMSAQGNVGSALGQRAGTITMAPNSAASGMARPPIAAQENPAIYTAAACTKDPAFRIVALIDKSTGSVQYETSSVDPTVNGGTTGNPGGSAGTLDFRLSELNGLVTPGREFTILGCSLGNLPGRGVSQPSAMHAGTSTGLPAGYASGGNQVYVQDRTGNQISNFIIKSWNDKSISILVPPGVNPETFSPFNLVVQRTDGSLIVYYLTFFTNR